MVVRGLTSPGGPAVLLEQLASGHDSTAAPDLLYAEVANALAQYVRAGKLRAEIAASDLEWVRSLPLETRPGRELAPVALTIALDRGVSVYDAMSLALARATDAILVTADRRLAGAAERSELLEG